MIFHINWLEPVLRNCRISSQHNNKPYRHLYLVGVNGYSTANAYLQAKNCHIQLTVPAWRLTWWPLLHSITPRLAIGHPVWLLHLGHVNPFVWRTRKRYSAQRSSFGNMCTKSSNELGLSRFGSGCVMFTNLSWVRYLSQPDRYIILIFMPGTTTQHRKLHELALPRHDYFWKFNFTVFQDVYCDFQDLSIFWQSKQNCSAHTHFHWFRSSIWFSMGWSGLSLYWWIT